MEKEPKLFKKNKNPESMGNKELINFLRNTAITFGELKEKSPYLDKTRIALEQTNAIEKIINKRMNGTKRAREGLKYIFEGLNCLHFLDEMINKKLILLLKEHPFNLDAMSKNNPKNEHIYFIGKTLFSDQSQKAMTAYIRAFLAENDTSILKLRVIKCQIKESQKHNIYFDLDSSFGEYICGGCTDYSDSGNTAREKLEAIFGLLKLLYGCAIETVVIPSYEAKKLEKNLKQYLTEYPLG